MSKFVFGEAIGEVLRASHFVEARNIRGGAITAQEIVIAGGTKGVIRSAGFVPSPLAGWAIYGDGTAYFGAGVTVGGDIVSANWDGTNPPNLSSRDTGATAGFALDSSVGAAQFMGNIWLGGSLIMAGSGKFATASSGDRIEIDAAKALIKLYDATNGLVGQMGWAATGFGTDDLVIENQSGLGDIELHADGLIELDAGGSAGLGVHISNGSPAGAIPAHPLVVEGVGGFRVSNAAPHWRFDDDLDTGISWDGTNQIALHAGGSNQLHVSTSVTTNLNDQFRCSPGSASSPGIVGNNDFDTGIAWLGSNILNIATAGVSRIVITSSVYDNGLIRDTTTGSGANVFINATSGRMARVTSSLKAKPGWRFVDEDWLADLEMPAPITWQDEWGGLMLGFGTEHIREMLPEATQDWTDEEDAPLNYDVRSLVAVLSAKIKRLERQVEELVAAQ